MLTTANKILMGSIDTEFAIRNLQYLLGTALNKQLPGFQA